MADTFPAFYGRVKATWDAQLPVRKAVVLDTVFALVFERSQVKVVKVPELAKPAQDMINETVEDFDQAAMDLIQRIKEEKRLAREARDGPSLPHSPPSQQVVAAELPVTNPINSHHIPRQQVDDNHVVGHHVGDGGVNDNNVVDHHPYDNRVDDQNDDAPHDDYLEIDQPTEHDDYDLYDGDDHHGDVDA